MKAAKMASANIIATLSNMALSLIFALLIFRWAPTADIGTYYFWLSLMVFANFIVAAPLNGLIYILPKKKLKDAKAYMLLTDFLVGIIALIIYVPLFAWMHLPMPYLLAFMASIVVVGNASTPQFLNTFREKLFLFNVLGGPIAKISYIIGAYWLKGTLTFTDLATGLFLGTLLKALVLLLANLEGLRVFTSLKKAIAVLKDVGINLKAGIMYYMTTVLMGFLSWTDIAFIGLFMGVQAVGVYNAIGNMMKYIMGSIPGGLTAFIFPFIVKGRKDEKAFLKKATILTALFILPFAIVGVMPEPFVRVLTGSRYVEYAHLAEWFLPAILLVPFQAVLMNYFLAKKKAIAVIYLVASIVINVLVNYVFGVVLGWGLTGVILATSASAVLLVSLLAYKAWQEDKLSMKHFFRYLLAAVIVSAILFAAKPYLKFSYPTSLSALIISIVLGGIAFVISSLILGIVYREEIPAFINIAKSLMPAQIGGK